MTGTKYMTQWEERTTWDPRERKYIHIATADLAQLLKIESRV